MATHHLNLLTPDISSAHHTYTEPNTIHPLAQRLGRRYPPYTGMAKITSEERVKHQHVIIIEISSSQPSHFEDTNHLRTSTWALTRMQPRAMCSLIQGATRRDIGPSSHKSARGQLRTLGGAVYSKAVISTARRQIDRLARRSMYYSSLLRSPRPRYWLPRVNPHGQLSPTSPGKHIPPPLTPQCLLLCVI